MKTIRKKRKSDRSLWILLALIAVVLAVILLLPSCGGRAAKGGTTEEEAAPPPPRQRHRRHPVPGRIPAPPTGLPHSYRPRAQRFRPKTIRPCRSRAAGTNS